MLIISCRYSQPQQKGDREIVERFRMSAKIDRGIKLDVILKQLHDRFFIAYGFYVVYEEQKQKSPNAEPCGTPLTTARSEKVA
jgi:hypothetical protein